MNQPVSRAGLDKHEIMVVSRKEGGTIMGTYFYEVVTDGRWFNPGMKLDDPDEAMRHARTWYSGATYIHVSPVTDGTLKANLARKPVREWGTR